MYFYAGSFCPPTVGHEHIVEKALKRYSLSHLIIVCSGGNPNKDNMFSEEQCKQMWEASLESRPDLSDARVATYKSVVEKTMNFSSIVLVRGVRGEEDLQQELETILLNHEKYKIDSHLLVFADEHKDVSSTRAREAFFADDYEELTKYVKPKVAYLMRKFHDQNQGKERE